MTTVPTIITMPVRSQEHLRVLNAQGNEGPTRRTDAVQNGTCQAQANAMDANPRSQLRNAPHRPIDKGPDHGIQRHGGIDTS